MSLPVGVVGNCLIGVLIGIALQPSRVPSDPVLVTPTRENTPRLGPGVCGCGRASAERQAALKVSDQNLPVKSLIHSSTLLWDSLSECVRA